MISRKQRLSNACTHRQYWGQYVTNDIKRDLFVLVGDNINNNDEGHTSSFGMDLNQWDSLASVIIMRNAKNHNALKVSMKKAGDFISLAGLVSLLKEAARQIKEQGGV